LGWTDGRNVRIDFRWTGGDTNRIRTLAQELVGLQPDIIQTTSTPATAAVERETRTIPICERAPIPSPVASSLHPVQNDQRRSAVINRRQRGQQKPGR
jgi:putative ABC transport system substrate-binding protein